ncbi:Orcokinin peptides type A [Trichinella pseudospiralis]|uniref:Orcokinin peptides type A n=1 Tax=Trichinella pseudospiralis TaxID=6337 RepID=A0A0V0XXM5_TRIPS|nr:Orcokinin peptides type A [Trichinella pseudospiralis]
MSTLAQLSMRMAIFLGLLIMIKCDLSEDWSLNDPQQSNSDRNLFRILEMYRALGGKKNSNQFDIGFSGFSKRPFDRLEGAHFSGFDKRTLDLLEGSSMSGFNKRYFDVPRLYIKKNFDKFDSATLSGFRRKRMLDNIDSAGFAFSK